MKQFASDIGELQSYDAIKSPETASASIYQNISLMDPNKLITVTKSSNFIVFTANTFEMSENSGKQLQCIKYKYFQVFLPFHTFSGSLYTNV